MENKIQQLIIFDIDGTLLPEQSQFLLLKYLRSKKVIGVTYFLRLYFWFILYKLGIVKDPVSVFQYAIKFLEGKSINEVSKVMNDFVKETMSKHFFPEVLDILERHQKEGDRVMLVSNAVDVLVYAVAKHLNIKEYIGTELEMTEEHIFTGMLVSGITYGSAKVQKLKLYLTEDKGLISTATCYTDHHSDVPLLEVVRNPFVVNPTRKLEHIAGDRNWSIIVPGNL